MSSGFSGNLPGESSRTLYRLLFFTRIEKDYCIFKESVL